jgi:hypothetical protein
LIAGIYNDLNQIRAGETLTPETSTWCSVWYRIEAEKQQKKESSVALKMKRDWIAGWHR